MQIKKNIICLFIFLFITQGIIAQDKEKLFIFFVKEIINNMPEHNSTLFSYKYNKQTCLFVRYKYDYIKSSEVIYDSLNNGQLLYISSPSVIFTFDVKYWLQFKKFEINENESVFEFKTCSWSKLKNTKYLKGKMVFKKDSNEKWRIEYKKIKKVKFTREAWEIEKFDSP